MTYESTITFTLDTICPWTYLGFSHLQKALAQWHSSYPDSTVSFTLRLAPYQLYPDFSHEGEPKYNWYRSERYNGSQERMQMYIQYMTALGKDDDIAFDFQNGMIANTFHAHRILQYLQSRHAPSIALLALESLYKAYFSEGAHPSSNSTLLQACAAAGLPEDEAKTVVEDDQIYMRETKATIQEQVGNAVDSVPSVVFEGRRRDFTLVGAKSVEEYVKVLAQILKEAT